jgi:hypothetical protein
VLRDLQGDTTAKALQGRLRRGKGLKPRWGGGGKRAEERTAGGGKRRRASVAQDVAACGQWISWSTAMLPTCDLPVPSSKWTWLASKRSWRSCGVHFSRASHVESRGLPGSEHEAGAAGVAATAPTAVFVSLPQHLDTG